MQNRPAVLLAFAACLIACDDPITEADRVEIAFATAADTLFKSASIQLTPTITRNGAATSPAIAWTSSDTLVATVSPSGVVKAIGRGSAVVTASVSSVHASKTIVVDSLREVRLSRLSPALYAGDSLQLSAIGIGLLREVALGRDLTWSVDDPRVATVNANGMVVGRGPGVTRILVSQHLVNAATSFGVLPATANRHAACTGPGTIHRGSVPSGTWRAADGPHFLLDSVFVTRLTVEAGTTVCGLPGSRLVLNIAPAPGALLEALGTLERPVRFTAVDTAQRWLGIDGRFGNVDFVLDHAVVELGTRGVVGWGGRMSIQDSRFERTGVEYCADITTVDIRRTIFNASSVCISDGLFEDNVIRGAGLTVFRDRATPDIANVVGCRISDSKFDGIRVLAGATARIRNCNLERNAGFGVNNFGTIAVSAKHNWWGDPAGPDGPAGDGVSGNVDASEPLPAPRP